MNRRVLGLSCAFVFSVLAACGGDEPAPPIFTDIGDGMMQDNLTGLIWQKDVSFGNYTQEEAIAYCRDLPLAGGLWRLPTRSELLAVIHPTGETWVPPTPTDSSYFLYTKPDWFWSSSASDSALGAGWTVSFNGLGGPVGSDGIANSGPVTDRYSERCVR